jgi:hypothetical protein
MYRNGYGPQKVNSGECNSTTVKIISKNVFVRADT